MEERGLLYIRAGTSDGDMRDILMWPLPAGLACHF